MEKGSFDFVKRYLETVCPSGFEAEASRVWREGCEGWTSRVWRDIHGNSFAVVNQEGAPRVMLASHTDEIGLLITNIDDSGYLYFTEIGNWDPQILPGQRVWIQGKSGQVTGAIGRKPIYLLQGEEREKAVKLEDLWIDIGAADKEEAQELISIGNSAVVAYSFATLRNDLVIARGADGRVGAWVTLEAAWLLAQPQFSPKAAIYAVGTVQQEIGLRGMRIGAFGIDPKVVIAVDVDFATDTPAMDTPRKQLGEIKVGKGPIISCGANINSALYEMLVSTAEEKRIPYQIKATPRGTRIEAEAIQPIRAGVATALVSIPMRYMHSPCEIISLEDMENSAKLLAYTVEKIEEGMDFL